MNTSLRERFAKGFTLIELLIVVIIIAILAAIAIPQFSNTTGDAQESSLDANLNTMRSAIELYRIQHSNVLPAVAASSGATSCTGTGAVAGAGNAGTDVAFKDQMLMFSDSQGHTCSVGGGAYIYGPYLRAFPKEPITNPPTDALTIISIPGVPTQPDAAAAGGWRFNTSSGRLDMNTAALDRKNTPLYLH